MLIQDYLNQCEVEELDPYYIEKERKNQELVKCWAWTVVFGLGIAVWCLAIKGIMCWLNH